MKRVIDQCMELVGDPPGYWHFHQCTRKAKWTVIWDGEVRTVCGQHIKWCGQHIKWYQRKGVPVAARSDEKESHPDD